MNKPRPSADILRAIADGKIIEHRYKRVGWVSLSPSNAIRHVLAGGSELRIKPETIKPETININGHEVDPPVREPLNVELHQERQMTLTDIKLGISPITDTVMLGTLDDANTWRDKRDCTSDFCGALLTWVPPGTVREIRSSAGRHYEIEVREIEARCDK